MAEPASNGVLDPIVISLEATFHGVRDRDWNSKLIQFPRGGILWGLHLSKQQNTTGNASRVVGCLVCFGPIKDHIENWSIKFDHVFTISCRRVGCAGVIRKNCCFSDTHHIVNNYEWGEHRLPLPENWGTHDNVRLSCHIYISETTGVNRDMLKESASQNKSQESVSSPLSVSQVESQVIKFFGDLLLNENIVYSEEGFEAVEKLSALLSFPNVIETCRQYLMNIQFGPSQLNDTELMKQNTGFNLTGFDYQGNTASRKERIGNLNENDIIAMFQHLCLIAFKKC
ncbi:MATH domain-containing protein [Caenorhabditis elegans]|uniref:MATH domain-containing protein n=1 Tax=Caenorhabditis elegans TaxID=6239 RepID=Q20488_CAEEL|nr:MATH domain-containing protein [Caenorhabditis elegans]CCD71358.1 MATH domain-containing protein [Caenorhabditis elegans]|eukprot:NP_509220.1 Uncharacterized protein CELE_F46H5.5 [Caenorhabditis elegans]